MTRNIWFRGAAPLDPHQAGTELLLTLVLLSQLGVVKISGREPSVSRPSPAPTRGHAARLDPQATAGEASESLLGER